MVDNMSGGGWSTWCRHRSVFHSKVPFKGIPACNSTTVKGEMARLGRTADRFPEKLKCQTFEWKTDLADIMSTNHHHLCCQPFRPTTIVYYHNSLERRSHPTYPQSTIFSSFLGVGVALYKSLNLKYCEISWSTLVNKTFVFKSDWLLLKGKAH